MAQTKKAPAHETLRTQLRAAGLRVTAPRVAVLQRLHAATGPVSHADLAETLSPDGWDRATIYRNLADLTEAGLVRRADLGDHVWRFELRGEVPAHETAASHAHFVCNSCGTVSCLPGDTVQIKPAGGPRALRTRCFEVQLKGTCDRCS